VRYVRLAATLIAAAALSACGGGGSHSSAVPAAGGGSAGAGLFGSRNAAPAPGAVAASLSITIPRPPHTSSTKRHAAYVSPATQGIAVEAIQNSQVSGYQFYALGEGPNCVLNGQQTAYVCTGLSVSAPPGSTQILVGTYDSAAVGEGGTPTGNLLAASQQTYTIQAGRTNNLTVTLLPVAAGVQASNPPPRCPIFNSGGVNLTTSYYAYDADNDDLSGMTLFNTISFTNDTNDGNYTLSPAAISSGSGTLNYTYTGTDPYPGIFTITTSIGTDGGSNEYVGIVPSIPVATPGPHYIYVADSANNDILGYDLCFSGGGDPTPNVYTLPAGTNPTEVKFDRNSSAVDPRLFVLSSAANNQLVWLDVSSTPGTVVQQPTFGGTPHEAADDAAGKLFVSIGGTTLKSWTVNEGAGTLTPAASNTTLPNPPRGFKLEGSGDDLLLGTTGGTIYAVNPSTLAIDGSVATGGTPVKLTGPDGPAPDCALAIDTTLGYTYAMTIRPTPETSPVHFNTIETAATPVTATFFPPATPGSGNLGIGGSTAIIITNGGGAQLGTCNGTAETWTSGALWSTFMSNPVAVVPSEYASNSVDTLIYVVGSDNGQPSLQAFASTYDHDLGSIQLPGGANPTSVTAGP
jgi:hypothetical protein